MSVFRVIKSAPCLFMKSVGADPLPDFTVEIKRAKNKKIIKLFLNGSFDLLQCSWNISAILKISCWLGHVENDKNSS